VTWVVRPVTSSASCVGGRPGGRRLRRGQTRRLTPLGPLRAAIPETQRTAIVHNDFKTDNCQFADGDPDVVSEFDWDMATLGDPLVDLGALLNYWPDEVAPAIAVPGLENLGLPTRREVVARYAQRSGLELDLERMVWYEAFGCWKTAIITQQLFVRYVRGETADDRMAKRGGQVQALAECALELLGAEYRRGRARRSSRPPKSLKPG
jgi:thiamine kinase-like enzyme